MRKIFYKATHFCSSLLCIICCSLVVQISASTDKSNSLILQSFDRTVFYYVFTMEWNNFWRSIIQWTLITELLALSYYSRTCNFTRICFNFHTFIMGMLWKSRENAITSDSKNCDNPQYCITTVDCHSFFWISRYIVWMLNQKIFHLIVPLWCLETLLMVLYRGAGHDTCIAQWSRHLSRVTFIYFCNFTRFSTLEISLF